MPKQTVSAVSFEETLTLPSAIQKHASGQKVRRLEDPYDLPAQRRGSVGLVCRNSDLLICGKCMYEH